MKKLILPLVLLIGLVVGGATLGLSQADEAPSVGSSNLTTVDLYPDTQEPTTQPTEPAADPTPVPSTPQVAPTPPGCYQ